MEIGSFIELELKKGKEYYKGKDIARLNSGRAGIYHALKVLNCSTIHLPYYQCDTVRDFFYKKNYEQNINTKFYYINNEFDPVDLSVEDYEAVLLVNYFGIMSFNRMKVLSDRYKNAIIDNSQAFFAKPINTCMNVYSARKFFGVPDGCYVIGKNAGNHVAEYEQDYSSDTSLFLLQRIEYGCEGKAYEARMLNEQRINKSDIQKMSKLTHAILDGTDYDYTIKKRRENFKTACALFDDINLLNAKMYYDDDCVPMVYPLVIEDENLLPKLLRNKIFQGHWWSYLLNEMNEDSFEYYLCKYIIPITIDQRYGIKELEFIRGLIV